MAKASTARTRGVFLRSDVILQLNVLVETTQRPGFFGNYSRDIGCVNGSPVRANSPAPGLRCSPADGRPKGFFVSVGVLALATATVAAVIPAVVASRREPIRELRVP